MIGASGIDSARIDVLAIRLTPIGTFICVVKSGESKCVTTCAPCDSIHSKNAWSLASVALTSTARPVLAR